MTEPTDNFLQSDQPNFTQRVRPEGVRIYRPESSNSSLTGMDDVLAIEDDKERAAMLQKIASYLDKHSPAAGGWKVEAQHSPFNPGVYVNNPETAKLLNANPTLSRIAVFNNRGNETHLKAFDAAVFLPKQPQRAL